MKEIHGEFAYGYLYGTQLGYLDYALVNTNLFEDFWTSISGTSTRMKTN